MCIAGCTAALNGVDCAAYGAVSFKEATGSGECSVCPGQVTDVAEFKLPWREAGPPNHHDDKVDSDQ